MQADDARGRTPRDARQLDIVRLLDGQDLAAHLARIARPVEQADDDDDIFEARPLRRGQHDGHQHGGDGEEGVHDAHQHHFPPAAEIARHQADEGADDPRHDDRHQRHAEGDARAIDDAGENVATEEIGPQRMGPGAPRDPGGRTQPFHEALLGGRIGREQGRGQRHHQQNDDDQQGQQRQRLQPCPQGWLADRLKGERPLGLGGFRNGHQGP